MAKLIVAVLFLLFAFTHARFPSDIRANEDVSFEPSKNLPESDPKPTSTILLPSQKSESEATTLVHLEPETTESKFPEHSIRATEATPEDIKESNPNDETPLATITFRPINRHFPRRPFPFTFRHGHPCHHHRQAIRNGGSDPQRAEEIPYGDDMILSGFGDRRFDSMVRSRVPARWITLRRFADQHDDMMERPFNYHRHQHHHHSHAEEGEEDEDHHHKYEHGHGFLKSFRKFLPHF